MMVLFEESCDKQKNKTKFNNNSSPENTLLHSIDIDIQYLCLSASSHEPEEKPLSPLLRSGSGTLRSHSATALDPSDPSYRNYLTKIQAELSPQKSPAVSYNMPDEKCIGNEACN